MSPYVLSMMIKSAAGNSAGDLKIISLYLPISPLKVSVFTSSFSLIFKFTAALPIICPASVYNNSTLGVICVGLLYSMGTSIGIARFTSSISYNGSIGGKPCLALRLLPYLASSLCIIAESSNSTSVNALVAGVQ